jgi:hypothetical protein
VGGELAQLRATCRRQAHVIEMLVNAVSTLRDGAAALNAENADLRAAYSQESSHARAAAWAERDAVKTKALS